MKLIELALVLAASIAPTFLLASNISGDEFAKAGSSAALAGIVLAVYKAWKGHENGDTK
jgi:uncharacterized protein (UPF0333 family)